MVDCPFCTEHDVIIENEYWFSIYDKFPVSSGHVLIISKRHYLNYFDSYEEELNSFNDILFKVKEYITTKYRPDGMNVGFNVNREAGQTVFHCHIHVIPRYRKDIENPRGGVRGVIPNKKDY